jgi:hypothetical protein
MFSDAALSFLDPSASYANGSILDLNISSSRWTTIRPTDFCDGRIEPSSPTAAHHVDVGDHTVLRARSGGAAAGLTTSIGDTNGWRVWQNSSFRGAPIGSSLITESFSGKGGASSGGLPRVDGLDLVGWIAYGALAVVPHACDDTAVTRASYDDVTAQAVNGGPSTAMPATDRGQLELRDESCPKNGTQLPRAGLTRLLPVGPLALEVDVLPIAGVSRVRVSEQVHHTSTCVFVHCAARGCCPRVSDLNSHLDTL